jgi:hypothetical protein
MEEPFDRASDRGSKKSARAGRIPKFPDAPARLKRADLRSYILLRRHGPGRYGPGPQSLPAF